MKIPWDRPIVVSVMEQTLELSGQAGGRTAMASDGTVLRIDSILRYRPIESELGRFLFGLRAPIEHITHVFTCLLRNAIAGFAPDGRAAASTDFLDQGGAYAVIRRERQRLNREIEQMAREHIGDRYGVRFSAVDMTDILPPDELADALNAVIYARTDAEAQYFRAQGDCRQRVIAAERGIAIASSRAQAIETEIRTLGTALGALEAEGTLDEYVERRRSEVLSESRTLYLKDGH
jgi:regulator of protease activity HflC (stomatin/prohibitin superfamily)